MRLALFDDYRLGVVAGERGEQIADVTGALPAHDADPVRAAGGGPSAATSPSCGPAWRRPPRPAPGWIWPRYGCWPRR